MTIWRLTDSHQHNGNITIIIRSPASNAHRMTTMENHVMDLTTVAQQRADVIKRLETRIDDLEFENKLMKVKQKYLDLDLARAHDLLARKSRNHNYNSSCRHTTPMAKARAKRATASTVWVNVRIDRHTTCRQVCRLRRQLLLNPGLCTAAAGS